MPPVLKSIFIFRALTPNVLSLKVKIQYSVNIQFLKTISSFQITSDGTREPPHLVNSKYPRFCDEIRYGSAKYTKYFRLVFQNKTFRVYEIKPWKGDFTKNTITAL